MFDTPGAEKGIQAFKEIVEAERILRLRDHDQIRGRLAYLLVLTAFSKDWALVLTANVLSDFLNNREYKEFAQFYAHELAMRMRNPLHNGFFCKSGRPVSLEFGWPTEPIPSRAASALPVYVRDTRDGTHADCYVVISHQQSVFDLKANPFLIQNAAVNSVRYAVDDGNIEFYQDQKHPTGTQQVKLRLECSQPASRNEIDSFLRGKVHWLGFRVSNSLAQVWIPDSWDAIYLGCETKDLLQQAEILGASEELKFNESHEFASIGKNLLRKINEIEEPKSTFVNSRQQSPNTEWDVFVSHATEDKDYVGPLVDALQNAGIRVWFDRTTLEWGDDLRASIDRGLTACKYGIVVFSKAFLGKKKWTEYELNSLFAREQLDMKVILPIWHGIKREDLIQYSPSFADRLAKISSTDSYGAIVKSLLAMLGRPGENETPDTVAFPTASGESTEPKPNAVAFARYETTGENAQRAAAYVRPSSRQLGWFSFESSLGDLEHGERDKIALRFVAFDRSLTTKGYIRTHYGAGDPYFAL